jgi:predicted RNA-binding Zn-ribbon protein involved in translation (DUF1610 family)
MARRRKSSLIEDLIGIAAALPWWAGALLALTSYFFLHNIATAPQINTTNLPGQLGSIAVSELKRTLALYGQYILPFAFSLGAFLSLIRNKKDKNEKPAFSSYSKPGTSGNTPSCPNCGNSMVKRKAKKGANAGGYFWGCSSFPQCYGKRDY